MTDLVLRLLYGAIVISSGFLIGSMSRLATREMRRIGVHDGLRSVYFWLAANLAVSSAGLVIICGIRVWDAFHGGVAGSEWGFIIALGFGLLLLSKVGFTWAGTLEMKHGVAIWRSYLLSLIGWVVFVLLWTY